MIISDDLFFSEIWQKKLDHNPYVAAFRYKESSLYVILEIKQKFGLDYGICPFFSPYNAILTHPHEAQSSTVRFNTELKLYQKLLDHRFPFPVVQIKFPLVNVHLPMMRSPKMVSNIAFTEIIHGTKTVDEIWSQLSSEIRNDINFAQQHCIIHTQNNTEEIASFLLTNPYYFKTGISIQKLNHLLIELTEISVLKTVVIKHQGHILSCGIFVKNQDTLHYIMNANNKLESIRGAHLAVIWKGIQLALLEHLNFNFNGSLETSITKVFKCFGSETMLYPNTKIYASKIIKRLDWILGSKQS